MVSDYKTYLAANVLNEEKIVTYRLLSHALKVHVNQAKEMLFDFHAKENAKKPNSVHATYLIAGSRHEASPTNGSIKKDGDNDVVMASSQPFPSSPPVRAQTDDDTPILSITLAREEDLDEVRKQYESITSIHIYSLGPTIVKDLQVLTEANREISEKYSDVSLSTIGGITNKHVRKRKIGGEQARTAAATVAAMKPAAPLKKDEPVAKIKEPAPSAPRSSANFFGKKAEPAKSTSTAKSTPEESDTSTKPGGKAATAPLKRGNSSLMASFAKAKPKVKKEKTDSSAAATPASGSVDSPMAGVVSDDEEDTYVVPAPKVKAEGESTRASRKEREEKLRRMMEEESEEEKEESAAVTPKSALGQTPDDGDVEMGDADAEPVEPKKKEKEQKEYVVVENGRRRGKRRVMKRKTTRDAEGYIVTREEPAWESFSEEEVAPKPKAAPKPAVGSKAKKPAAKGQGNIMSFFSKKT